MLSQGVLDNDQRSTSVEHHDRHGERIPLRSPTSFANTHIAIILMVVLPIIFFIVICTLICCFYRFKRKSVRRSALNDSNAMPIIIPNTQYNPFLIEDMPPAYDLISDVKKLSGLQEEKHQTMSSPVQSIPLSTLAPPPPSYMYRVS